MFVKILVFDKMLAKVTPLWIPTALIPGDGQGENCPDIIVAVFEEIK